MAMLSEGRSHFAGAVLAAGASRRLGRPKQVAIFNGEALVRRAVRALIGSQCFHVAVVVGAHADETAAAIAGLGACLLVNTDWSEGVAASIRAATTWAHELGAEGLLIAVCDQPFMTTEHVDALLARFYASGRAVGSGYAGVIGVPAVFGRSEFAGLQRLRGDRGASALLRGADGVAWSAGAVDVDTEGDLNGDGRRALGATSRRTTTRKEV